MGKGNLLLGMGRGKVGDLVLTRGAGEQIVRARNRNPKNPQTTKQMAQRAALATVVEFFTRGKRNLFKFAFESKRKGESDYNAFVRANINRVPVQSRKTIVENGPIFGEFVLTQGSLTSPRQGMIEEGTQFALLDLNLGVAGAALTIGKLSQSLINAYGYENGDIITCVAINSSTAVVDDIAEAITTGALSSVVNPTSWVVKQFTLDSSSTALVSALGIFNTEAITASSTSVSFLSSMFNDADLDTAGFVAMGAVIVSRNTASGLKVSTTQLTTSVGNADAVSVGMSDEWKIWVAKHWNDATTLDVAPDNILEGSISEN